MIVIPQNLIRQNLDYRQAIDLIAEGFCDFSSGRIQNRNRKVFDLNGETPVLGVMPAGNQRFMSIKVAAVKYQNALGLDSHQGAVLLFDRSSGVLKAVLDATELTAIRTAAVSGLAVGLLSKERVEIKRVAIIGSGVQAYHHINMFSEQFGSKDFVVISRSPERVRDLAAVLGHNIRIEHRLRHSALFDCQIVVTATHGDDVVIDCRQIADDTIVIAIGACKADAQEVSYGILERSVLVADCKDACIESSGEGRFFIDKPDRTCLELADLLNGSIKPLPNGTIVFKSVGLGFQDLVCAQYLYEKLLNDPAAVQVKSFGGQRAY